MRPKKQQLSAAGASSWIPVNRYGGSFGLTAACHLSQGATLTYSVQYATYDVQDAKAVTISRSTTTATITFPSNHGLAAGDSVNVIGTSESNLDGVYAVASVPSETTVTYTVSDTGATSASGKAVAIDVNEHDTITGLSADAVAGFTLPCSAVRANVSAYTDGVLTVNFIPVTQS